MSTDIVKKNKDVLYSLKTAGTVTSLLKDLKSPEKFDKLLLILLDSSGSMADDMDRSTKIAVAWDVFHKKLLPNMSGWGYGIICFGGNAYWELYPTSSPNALNIRNPGASGGTSMGAALNLAWSCARTQAKEARFVLLSDGKPNDMPQDTILSMVAECNQIPIDTVGIGEKNTHSIWSSYDPEFLMKISSLTKGIFSEAFSVAKLSETIKKLSPAERPLLGKIN